MLITPSEKLTRALSISFVGIFTARALGFAINTFMARRLGSDAYGNFLVLLALVQFGAMLFAAGFDAGAARFIGLSINKNRTESLSYFWTAVFTLLISCGIGALIAYVLAPTTTSLFNARELPWLVKWGVALMVFTVFSNFFIQTLQAVHLFKGMIVIRDILEPLVRLAALSLGFLWGFRLAAATAGHMVGVLFILCGAGVLIFSRWPGGFAWAPPSAAAFKCLAVFSFPLLLTQMAGYFLQWADTLTLGALLTARDVGVYGAAQRWASLAGIPMAALTPLFLPIITRLYGDNDMPEVTNLYKRTTDGLNIVAWFCFFILWSYAGPLMSLFGPEYVPIGRLILRCLAVAGFIQLATGPTGSLFYMFGYSKVMFYNALFLVPLTLVLMYVLVHNFGVFGAAAGVIIMGAVSNVLNLVEIWMFRRLHPFSANTLKITLIGGGLSVVLYMARVVFEGHTYGMDLVLWLVLYPAALIKFVLSREDLSFWKQFFKIAP